MKIHPGGFSVSDAGYELSDDMAAVTFVYDPGKYGNGLKEGEKIYVAGTFNSWKEMTDGN